MMFNFWKQPEDLKFLSHSIPYEDLIVETISFSCRTNFISDPGNFIFSPTGPKIIDWLQERMEFYISSMKKNYDFFEPELIIAPKSQLLQYCNWGMDISLKLPFKKKLQEKVSGDS